MKTRVKQSGFHYVVIALLASTLISANLSLTAWDKLPLTTGGAFVDPFNDGEIGAGWEANLGDASSIYEAGGVLNMDIAGGEWQYIDINTVEHLLHGDFDLWVSFQVNPDFHSVTDPTEQVNVHLFVEVQRDASGDVIDRLTMGIFDFGYHSTEEGVSYSDFYGSSYALTPSDDLEGKLRIKRLGNVFTTYYWDHGWVQNHSWTPKKIFINDNLRIGLGAYHKGPDFPSFWVKWDNLIAHDQPR